MPQVTLHASASRAQGSANSRRLRHEGAIPGVVYGHGVAPVPVAVNAKEFRTAVSGEHGLNALITRGLARPIGRAYPAGPASRRLS
jgi:large subunit ribosomal protein L25